MSDTRTPPTDSDPFWQGLDEWEVRLPVCRACGAAHLPPGPVCPYCLSDDLDWRRASGKATLSTWVVERKKWFAALDPPYIVGEVELEEGPRMPVWIPIQDLPHLRIDRPGSIDVARAPNGRNLPHFHIAADG